MGRLRESNFLIVKIGAIGDVIMASAMIPVIRNLHENAVITWVVGQSAAELVRAIEGVDKVVVVDEKRLLRGTIFSRLRVVSHVWRSTAFRKYRMTIVAHSDRRYSVLSWFAVCREIKAFYLGHRTGPIPGRWFPNEYVRLVTGEEGPQVLGPRFPKIQLSQEERIKIGQGKGYVVIAPGGARNIMRDSPVRRWPVANYVDVAKELIRENYEVCVVGAESDRGLLEEFSGIDVIDICGRTSLRELCSVIAGATAVVTHDSMPLHMGILMGVPVVGIFGPTLPSVFARSVGDAYVQTLWGGERLSCSPCYDGKEFATCTDNVCMKSVSVDNVLRAIYNGVKNGEKKRVSENC